MGLKQIEELLISEVGLSTGQSAVFLYATLHDRFTAEQAAGSIGIAKKEVAMIAESLVGLGSLISMPGESFEAMHPRFTIVNMYKKRCAAKGMEFGRNKTIDAIGAALERPYERARAK